ncbi:MAG: hypothetical protein KA096_02220 [Bacteroidales bacterium]|nr:hypothetical protein [Bacteroidales bacterium]
MQVYKHDGTTRKQNSTWISSNSENSDWQAANDPCNLHLANGWRIPMNMKWSNVMGNEEWDNYSDTYTSVLRLYAAGYLIYSVGTLNNRGSYGFY